METPYYAVIFTSKLSDNTVGYAEMAEQLEKLLESQPGFMGMDSARGEVGITVCYWDSLESIKNWKNHELHQKAQQRGKKDWYSNYTVRVCKVEKEY
ncbi:MAG: antibiotic biosynthesis monooxygenase [Crocinitomicaceae bacterium]|nr:antibiotic biosynthesis monooxygenase [Crocinitomicaceae bacterium]